MSQYRAYPAYKDSGIEWIGQVPEHWQVKRLKHLISQCQNGVWGDDPLEDGSDTLCIRVADFDRDNNVVIYNPSTYRQITKEHQDSRLVSKGDILLEKSGGGAQTLVGANVRYLGEEPAVCSNFVAVIKPSKMAESAWLNYLMASMYALKINLRSIKQSTGIQNLDSEQYLDEGVAAPSLDEQATIAAALDRETARIDALVEKKTRFIELLKEKRQALITHAVTKGLDPNVNMKDSGVEWFGQVPEHWAIPALKFLLSTPITDGPHETPVPAEPQDGIVFISAEAVSSGRINFSKAWGYISRADHKRYSRKYKPQQGDIYMVKSGATTGITAMVEDNREFNIWSPLAAIRANSETAPKFLLYALRSTEFQAGVALNWSYGTQQNIGMNVLENLPLPIPPYKEQATIAATLERENDRIDALIGKAEQSITLLKERRSAFITAAVTGQIDLRGKQ